MSKKLGFFLLAMALISVLVACVGVRMLTEEARPTPESMVKTEEPISTKSQPTITPTSTVVPATPTPLPTSTPTATPTATPKVVDYKIFGVIDLAGGLPVAMVIYKPDGTLIKSNWAKPIAYNDGDDPALFDPHAGTVYSHRDDGFLATWIHSGMLKAGPLFGYELEKALWLNKQNQRLTLEAGKIKAAELLNSRVVVCQASADANIKPFDSFDPKAPCQGKQLEFTITAAALVERSKVDAYEAAIGGVVSWLVQNEPGTGFEKMTTGNGYLIQTCVGQYKDQVSDGTVDYIYNRLVLGLTLN